MTSAVKVINIVTQHSYAIKQHAVDIKEGLAKAVAMVNTADDTQMDIIEHACSNPTRSTLTTDTIKWNTHVDRNKV
jgi:hypothetical protein